MEQHFPAAGPNGPGTSQTSSPRNGTGSITCAPSQHRPLPLGIPHCSKTTSKPPKPSELKLCFQPGFTGEVCSPLNPLDKTETNNAFLNMLLVLKFLLVLSKIQWCPKQNVFSRCQEVYLYLACCHASGHTASHPDGLPQPFAFLGVHGFIQIECNSDKLPK